MNWTLLVGAVVVAVIVMLNLLARSEVQDLRQTVAERQAYVAESQRLEGINSRLIQALATRAAQTNDEEIRAMLAAQGVTFTLNVASSDELDTAEGAINE